jgi:hypothetical protein
MSGQVASMYSDTISTWLRGRASHSDTRAAPSSTSSRPSICATINVLFTGCRSENFKEKEMKVIKSIFYRKTWNFDECIEICYCCYFFRNKIVLKNIWRQQPDLLFLNSPKFCSSYNTFKSLKKKHATVKGKNSSIQVTRAN